MSTIKSSAENLTLNADGANNDIKFQSNGSEVASIDQAGSLVLSGNLTSLGIDDNADATAITIDASENVGIGTTSPVSGKKLHINDSSTWAALRFTGAGGNYLDIKSYGDTSSGSIIEAGGNQPLRTYVNGAERLRIQSTGGISFNGDTAAANALDDYEEGVHQYTITGSTSGSMTVRSGYAYLAYTKIGRVVHVQGRYETSGAHNAVGSLKFSLPFTAENLTDQAGVGGGFISLYRAGNVFNGLEARIYEADSFFYVFYQHATLDDEVVTGALVDSSIEGIFNFSYIAA